MSFRFLLTSAAFIMGAVGVWGMHFIGNNSMSLLINGEKHQLSYTVGYTIGSLAVACICMFIAFAFVGVTEEATLTRIAPSGVFAGVSSLIFFFLIYDSF
jgi:NO-binding membrane sensor protein with MHYT domain